MKEIMQTYGSMIIAAAICVLLLVSFVIVGRGAADALKQEDVLADDYSNNSYNNYRNEMLPQIELSDGEILYGEKVAVKSLFNVVTASENLSNIEVFAMADESGEFVSENLSNEGKSVTFPHAGIYELYIKIFSKNNIVTYAAVSIPVN